MVLKSTLLKGGYGKGRSPLKILKNFKETVRRDCKKMPRRIYGVSPSAAGPLDGLVAKWLGG